VNSLLRLKEAANGNSRKPVGESPELAKDYTTAFRGVDELTAKVDLTSPSSSGCSTLNQQTVPDNSELKGKKGFLRRALEKIMPAL
jgi:hypothetical protein